MRAYRTGTRSGRYEFGMQYGLENYAPWTTDGSSPRREDFAGQFVFDANDSVNEKLRKKGHSRCWSTRALLSPLLARKQPISSITDSGSSPSSATISEEALEAIDTVRWIPSGDGIASTHGRESSDGASRARPLGGAVTIFYCQACRTSLTKEAGPRRFPRAAARGDV